MFLSPDIVLIIADYAEEYKLKEGVDEKKLKIDRLYSNPNAFGYLLKLFGEERINWGKISNNENDNATFLLVKNHPEEIKLDLFSANSNPIAVDYMLKNPDKINYKEMSYNRNPKAIKFLLENHLDKICLKTLYSNPCDLAVEYILKLIENERSEYYIIFHNNHNPKMFHYYWNNLPFSYRILLSEFPNDKNVNYLLKNSQLIKPHFSSNPNPKAVDYLIKHPELISKFWFSRNKNPIAVDYLLKNPKYINWGELSYNPSIFEKDSRILEELNNVFGQ